MGRWWLAAVVAAAVAGCSEQGRDGMPVEEAAAGAGVGEEVQTAFADAEVTPEVMGMWARSCAMCHVNGEAGAPRIGDAEAWRGRLATGEDVLMTRTVEGYNDMPPLGYCMGCEREDLRALIRLMIEGVPS